MNANSKHNQKTIYNLIEKKKNIRLDIAKIFSILLQHGDDLEDNFDYCGCPNYIIETMKFISIYFAQVQSQKYKIILYI